MLVEAALLRHISGQELESAAVQVSSAVESQVPRRAVGCHPVVPAGLPFIPRSFPVVSQDLGVGPVGVFLPQGQGQVPVVLPQVLRSQPGEDGLTDPVVIDLDSCGTGRACTADEPLRTEEVLQGTSLPAVVHGRTEPLLDGERAGGHRDRFKQAACGLLQETHARCHHTLEGLRVPFRRAMLH